MWWWRFIVFAEPAHRRRRRIWLLLSLENTCSDYFQIFAVCILALGNLPGNFFSFFSSFNKIQDGRQNPISLSRAYTASWICFMFGLKGRAYPGRVLKSSWSDLDNENFFFPFQNFSRYFSFIHFGYHLNNIVIQLKWYLLGILTGPVKIVRRIVFIFSTKFQMADESHVIASPIRSREATYPGHMLIRFWCDSDIIFYVVYIKNWWQYCIFFIINVF